MKHWCTLGIAPLRSETAPQKRSGSASKHNQTKLCFSSEAEFRGGKLFQI